MTTALTKVGNSHYILFNHALMKMARLKVGDQVNVELHEGGTITLTPIRPRVSREEVSRVIKSTLKDHARNEEAGMSFPEVAPRRRARVA